MKTERLEYRKYHKIMEKHRNLRKHKAPDITQNTREAPDISL